MVIVRNVAALVLGVVLGGLANMSLIELSPMIVPYPEGVNPQDVESINANIHRYSPLHFLMPFLAHSIGTFIGAVIAFSVAATRKSLFAYAIGGFFLIGGIAASFMIKGPLWFSVVDITLAYIPVSWMVIKLLQKKNAAV